MLKKILFLSCFLSSTSLAHTFTECIEGMADFYPCDNIDLLHRVHLENLGTANSSAPTASNDIWGWTDPIDGKEYAILGLNNGTAFFDISFPTQPIYLGHLNTATSNSAWRDIKTYNNHAYIVAEAGSHGMQIFDLTQLRNVINPPVDFTATANYTEFSNGHNIVINEDSGFAYAVGTNTCSAGLHMMDLSNPIVPINSGCFSADGYTHDAQCVLYIGPDNEHVGKEICINSNEDTLTIVDVTDKNTPTQLSRTPYNDSRYTHQGWLTEDHRYFLMNDELDESNIGHNTKTFIWDLADIDAPFVLGTYLGPEASTDHNLYIKGNFAYLSNYSSGISILDINDIGSGNLVEVANFDTYPSNNNSGTFIGSWSNYPYFESGNVIASDVQGGLFIFDPLVCPVVEAATGLTTQANGDNSISLSWTDSLAAGESYSVYRSVGGCATDNFELIADQITSEQFIDDTASGQVNIGYKVTKLNAEGTCESTRSSCSETMTTGFCSAAPNFNGVNLVSSGNSNTCSLNIEWDAAASYCNSTSSYNIYKSTDEAFIPAVENLVQSNQTGLSWSDIDVLHDQTYFYVVRAVDDSNDSEDNNQLKQSNKPQGELSNGTWSVGAEIGDTGIGQSSRHLGWELVTEQVFDGDRSYWSQNENNACNRLSSETLNLTPGEASELSFFTYYDIESRWDGGLVEISTDGINWDSPAVTPAYPNTFRSSADECGYDENTPAFSGQQLSWQQHTMDLTPYQGQGVNIRFSYSTDQSVNPDGWFLDNIAVTNTQIPGVCTTFNDLIFADGFE